MRTQVAGNGIDTSRYAKCIANSKRMRFDIDRDVIRGRRFDFTKRFLPDGLSKVDRLDFLTANERRLLSQIQGRTYANMFGLVERFIAAKVLDVSHEHVAGRPERAGSACSLRRTRRSSIRKCSAASSACVRRACLKVTNSCPEPNAVASAVLAKSTWAVLALTCHIELLRAGALSREHRHGPPRCPSSGRMCSCFTGGKRRSTRSSTRWSGAASTPSSRPRNSTGP